MAIKLEKGSENKIRDAGLHTDLKVALSLPMDVTQARKVLVFAQKCVERLVKGNEAGERTPSLPEGALHVGTLVLHEAQRRMTLEVYTFEGSVMAKTASRGVVLLR